MGICLLQFPNHTETLPSVCPEKALRAGMWLELEREVIDLLGQAFILFLLSFPSQQKCRNSSLFNPKRKKAIKRCESNYCLGLECVSTGNGTNLAGIGII